MFTRVRWRCRRGVCPARLQDGARRIRGLLRRVGPLPPRFEKLVPDRLVRDVPADAVALLVPGLGGPGRVPAARAGLLRCASSPRPEAGVSTLTGGHPSRNTFRPALPARLTTAARSRARGRAGPDSFTLRVNEVLCCLSMWRDFRLLIR